MEPPAHCPRCGTSGKRIWSWFNYQAVGEQALENHCHVEEGYYDRKLKREVYENCYYWKGDSSDETI